LSLGWSSQQINNLRTNPKDTGPHSPLFSERSGALMPTQPVYPTLNDVFHVGRSIDHLQKSRLGILYISHWHRPHPSTPETLVKNNDNERFGRLSVEIVQSATPTNSSPTLVNASRLDLILRPIGSNRHGHWSRATAHRQVFPLARELAQKPRLWHSSGSVAPKVSPHEPERAAYFAYVH